MSFPIVGVFGKISLLFALVSIIIFAILTAYSFKVVKDFYKFGYKKAVMQASAISGTERARQYPSRRSVRRRNPPKSL